jgi:hypothetical protein
MELSLKPSPTNSHPLHGILIKDASAAAWLKAIEQMKLQLNDIRLYPIPGLEANTIWGCLVLCHHKADSRMAGKHELCQMLTPHLLIPERSALYPALSIHEVEKLFPSQLHIFHPEFGLAELAEELNLKELIAEPKLRSYHVTQPEKPVFIPMQVKSFQVKPLPPEEVLKQMDEKLFPQSEELPKEDLTKMEEARLKFYEFLYGKKGKEGKDGKPVGEGAEGSGSLASRYGEKLGALLDSLIPKNSGLSERMQKDFEELQRRNQAEIEKLMELFRNNPEEALKYAIPLDENGSVRGGEEMEFNLSKRWSDFSLGNLRAGSGSGSGSVDFGEEYRRQLRKQYNDTAEELIRKKEYEKAAFVYMKLLKDIHRAAGTLEEGKLYQEAATIYLKHANNKQKAAECYEKGKMINDAIDLYKELKQDEKVGDLYVSINRRKQADVHYELVVDDYRSKDQYLKASLIYRHKTLNGPGSQTLLLEGWRKQKDAFNCLHSYMNNIEDIKTLKQEINRIYSKELTEVNSPVFLQVIKHEYNKQNELAEPIKDMAYEIIASQISHNSTIVNELKEFNKNDKEIMKDMQRFTQRKRK